MAKPRVCIVLDRTACLRRSLDARILVERYIDTGKVDVVQEDAIGTADAAIIVTCGFNREAQTTSLDAIARAQVCIAPERILLLGCLPGTNPELIPGDIKWAIAPRKYWDVEAAMNALGIPTRPGVRFQKVTSGALGLRSHGMQIPASTYYLKVADGCTGNCRFCGIKSAIGELRSRDLAEIRKEAESAVAAGASALYLASDDLGAYGIDRGSTLPELLGTLLALVRADGGPIELELRNVINPMWLVRYQAELCDLLSCHRDAVRSLSIAIQSWDSETLRACGRYADVERVRNIISRLRLASPGLYMMGHLVVGLPGRGGEDVRAIVDAVATEDIEFWTCMKYYQHERAPFVIEGKVRPSGEMDALWRRFVHEVASRELMISDPASAHRLYVARRVNAEFVVVRMLRPEEWRRQDGVSS